LVVPEKDLKSSKPVLNAKEVRSVLKSFDEFNKKLVATNTKVKIEGLKECSSICSNACVSLVLSLLFLKVFLK